MPSLDLTINERYHLTRKLGEGGMGEVYLAEDPVMQREVALKFIRGPLGDPESYTRLLERFQREARTLARLSHPNIVHVYDFGEHEGRPYLVMEYLPGGSLAERMGTPMPWQEACQLAATVARALAFAHSEGVLHRDIKPSNILFTKTGEPVVTDFGLARVLDPGGSGGDSTASLSLIGAAQALGTPAYMAPEQWSGQATEQSDIYSLGVVLFQMLTGQVPYPGKTPGEVVTSTMMNPLPQPRELNANIPQDVEALVQKALARDPRARYGSMQMLQETLAYLGREDIEPPPAKQKPLPLKPMKSKTEKEKSEQNTPTYVSPKTLKIVAIFAGGIIIGLLLFMAIGNGWFDRRLYRTPTPEAGTLPEVTRSSPTKTSAPKATGTSVPTKTSIPPTTSSSYGIGSQMIGKDGMVMVYVPGGTFTMGGTAEEAYAECQKFRSDCNKDWFTDEEPPHDVTLDAYWIDQTEVTNAMYAQCVAAGKCSKPSSSNSHSRDSYYGNPQYADYPVIYVDWNQADDYCRWAERELPTEAQWEYAARGPNGYTYPWGNDAPTCERANYDPSSGDYCEGDTTAVDSHEAGKSWVGAYDLAGNVWEWVRDVYTSYTSGAVTNPLILSGGDARVRRGGCWYYNEYNIRSAYRFGDAPSSTLNYLGFRCSLPLE